MQKTSDLLKNYRKQNKLTQIAMAQALQVTLGAYRFWELGANQPSSENLEKIQKLIKRRG